jgi:hypothetical protein
MRLKVPRISYYHTQTNPFINCSFPVTEVRNNFVSVPRFDIAEKDMKALADRTERMVKRMEELLAAFGIKLQPSHAEDPSCPEVTRAEEQPTKLHHHP